MTTDSNRAISSWTWPVLIILLVVAVASLLPSLSGRTVEAGATCNPTRPHDAGSFDQTIESGGLTREYLLHVPPSYSGADTVPLVLNFHGLGGTAGQQAAYSGLVTKADQEGFIVVMPQALETALVPVRHWNIVLFPTASGEPDDLGFIADLLDVLESELCIDSARIFATGMSNGAEMTSRVACSLSDRVAAVAPVAGVYYPPLSPDIPETPGCPALTRAVSLIAFHGTGDTIIPFDGGPGGVAGLQLTLRDIDDEIIPEWAALNGCGNVPVEEQVTEHVLLMRYQGCDQDATVTLYIVEGGGHQWPGVNAADEISATDLMWEFFQAHPFVAGEPAPTPQAPTPQATTQATTQSVVAPSTGASDRSSGANLVVWLVAGIAGIVVLAGAGWYTRRRA